MYDKAGHHIAGALRDTGRFDYAWICPENRLYFARLHADAQHLHLIIDTAVKFEGTVGIDTCAIASSIRSLP